MPELWLKDTRVLLFQEERGKVQSVQKIYTPELLPICLTNECSEKTFSEWMNRRSMPENREGLNDALSEFGNDWVSSKNKASLSDQYWIKYRMEEWKNVNFFTRIYSQDIGDLMFKPWMPKRRRISSDSPDLTTNGVLRKRWKQRSDKSSYLIKAGSKVIGQEPLSEVLASVLLEQIGVIPFVRYDLCIEGVAICSMCDNFITADTELVPASFIYNIEERKENESIYGHLLRMCEKFEIEGAQEYIDGLIYIDTLTNNADRNLGNIAFIRDVNTLKITPAPAFDFGAAYWGEGKIDSQVKSRLFNDVEKKIFKRMSGKYDLESIRKNKDYIGLIEYYPSISDERKKELIKAIEKRNEILCRQRSDDLEL